MQEEANKKIWTKRFISLFITNMSVFFVFYGLVTTLPLYAIDILHQTDKEAGLLLTTFLLSAIVVRPFSGKLLDVFGKKKLLVISIALYLFSTILYLYIKPLALLLILRFFNGVWFSIITTAAGSLAADIVPVSRKGTGLGYFTMSTNLSVVIGPFVGLLLVRHASYNTLFYVLSGIVLLGGLIALTVKTDDLPKPKALNGRLSFTFHDLFEIKALAIAGIASLVAFSYASVLSFISIYAQQQGLISVASWFYAVFAAAMLLTRPTTGKLYDQQGPQYVIIPGFIFFAVGLVFLSLVSGPVLFLCSAIFVGIGYGALTTSFQSLAVQSADHTRSGYATATYFTLFDFGIAIGSYILGIIASSSGYSNVYLVAAAVIVITFCIYIVRFLKLRAKKLKVPQGESL